MAADKPRILQNNRDMAWSILPLVVICLIIAGIASQCTLSPGGPTTGQIPHFDAAAALKYDAGELSFPVRNPSLPEGWQANSGSRGTVAGQGGDDVSTVGFITDRGGYLRLSQSAATEETLVPWVAGGPRTSTGVEPVGGNSWVQYLEEGSEPIWVANLGNVRVLITGSGSTAEFSALATAVGAAPPLAP